MLPPRVLVVGKQEIFDRTWVSWSGGSRNRSRAKQHTTLCCCSFPNNLLMRQVRFGPLGLLSYLSSLAVPDAVQAPLGRHIYVPTPSPLLCASKGLLRFARLSYFLFSVFLPSKSFTEVYFNRQNTAVDCGNVVTLQGGLEKDVIRNETVC